MLRTSFIKPILAVAFMLALAAPASASAAWGTIYVNPHTVDVENHKAQAGVSYGYATLGKAKRRAQKECPGKCVLAGKVHDYCGATGLGVNEFRSGFGSTKKKAIRHMRQRFTRHATLVAWVCSG